MTANDDRRTCIADCETHCKTCDPEYPEICLSCVDNLKLEIGGVCDCGGYNGY